MKPTERMYTTLVKAADDAIEAIEQQEEELNYLETTIKKQMNYHRAALIGIKNNLLLSLAQVENIITGQDEPIEFPGSDLEDKGGVESAE